MDANKYLNSFIIEAHDLLEDIERVALSLESGAPTVDAVNEVFRAFHTIKGSAGVCGLDDIVDFTHHIENLLDLVREGKIAVSPPLIDLVLRSEDQITAFIGALQGEDEVDPAVTEKLVGDICARAGLPHAKGQPKQKKKISETEEIFLF